MNDHVFHLNAADYGVPSRDEFIDLRIWDLHYHGVDRQKEVMKYVDRMGVEHVISLDIGGGWRRPPEDREALAAKHMAILEQYEDRMSGIIRIDPSQPERSVAHMETWIRNGPCIGIKYAGGNPGGIPCDHPNNDAIISLAAELGAVVYIHTWIKVGGEPRYAGGGGNFGESKPQNVVNLAKRFPGVPLICGHSGGDWELAARVVRTQENVFFEFSGSDPHSGQVDYAVNHLGADRIVWGGHGESRSYSTEMSKVLDADLTHDQRMKIFGRNLRMIAAPIMRSKGRDVTI